MRKILLPIVALIFMSFAPADEQTQKASALISNLLGKTVTLTDTLTPVMEEPNYFWKLINYQNEVNDCQMKLKNLTSINTRDSDSTKMIAANCASINTRLGEIANGLDSLNKARGHSKKNVRKVALSTVYNGGTYIFDLKVSQILYHVDW